MAAPALYSGAQVAILDGAIKAGELYSSLAWPVVISDAEVARLAREQVGFTIAGYNGPQSQMFYINNFRYGFRYVIK